jgi:type II secretory pathway component GspD/PulD (secretin)
MTRFLPTVIFAAAMAFAPLSNAQFGPDNRYAPAQVTALIDQVHNDLDRSYRVFKFSDSDRDRLNNAEKQLREFADKWSKAKFDKSELDDAINALQHVLDDNKLPPENRDALSADITQLRNMRTAYERHEIG